MILIIPPGRRACLVDHDGREPAGHLQGITVHDQYALPARPADGGDSRKGDRDAQGAGTGNHQHGDHPDEGLFKGIPHRGQNGPGCKGHKDHHGPEDGHDAVCQALGRVLLHHGLFHQRDHPSDGTAGTHPRDSNPEFARHEPAGAEDGVPRPLCPKPGLSRELGFIDPALPGEDDAVHRDLLLFQGSHHVSGCHRLDGCILLARFCLDPGLSGKQLVDLLHAQDGPVSDPGLQVFSEENQGNEHTGGVKVHVEAAAEELIHAQAIGRKGPKADQGLHHEAPRFRRMERPSQHGKPAVEDHHRAHQEDRDAHHPDGCVGQLGQEPLVDPEGDHHDVHGQEDPDPQPNEFCPQGPFLLLLGIRFLDPVPQVPDCPCDFARPDEPWKVGDLDAIRRERRRCADNALLLAEGPLDHPGTGGAPHAGHLEDPFL